MMPLAIISLLATIVLLFGFQSKQIVQQPIVIALLAVPIIIQVYLNSGGLDEFILKETFQQVAECRKSGILINTFMLARDPYLVQFVQRVSEIAQGKAYFTSTLTLGQSIMMDFLKRKRQQF